MNTPKPFGRPSKSGLSVKMLGQAEYERRRHAMITGQNPEDLVPRPNEKPLKEWLFEMAQKLHCSVGYLRNMMYHHKIKTPPMRRVNKRVIFVIQ